VRRAPIAALLLLAALPASAREKTDVVILRNGDRFTGEVKGLDRGKLDFSTDDAGRISIEWDKVRRLDSIHKYEVELVSGERIYGVLDSPADGDLAVGALPMPEVVPMASVVQLVPMDESFVNRLRVIFDLGFTLAKANWATTLSTSGEFGYRAEDLGAQLKFDAYFQRADGIDSVNQWTASVQGDWYFKNRWRALLAFQAQANSQLQLLLRATVASGVAYSAVRNGWTEVWLTAGLAGSQETYSTVDPIDASTDPLDPTYTLDAMLVASWDAFRYDTPKLDMNASLVLFPGLSDFGRLRGTFTLKVKYEIFKDFNAGLSFSDTFDTSPPEGAPNNDFITSITVGWSYRR
jgi:hypothetical protein